MAVVTFSNATSTAGPVSANTRALLHTAGANTVLLVAIHSSEANSMSAVVAAGVGMSRLGFVVAGTGHTELWGLTAPATGTLTISAAVSGNNPATFAVAAATFTGHRTTATPFGGVVAQSSDAGTVANISLSSRVDDLGVIVWGLSANATITLSLNQTSRANTTHSTSGRLVIGEAAGTPTLSASASASALGNWGTIAINLLASASVAPSAVIARMSLLGVGA